MRFGAGFPVKGWVGVVAGLPPIKYGKVVGRFLSAIADGPDVDDTPDFVPLSGTITFFPRASKVLVPTAVPDPATVFPSAVRVSLDEFGYITWRGKRGVFLMSPSDFVNPGGWTWQAQFDLRFEGTKIQATSFDFQVPEFVAGPDPLDPDVGSTAVDLTLVSTVPGYSGNPIVRGPRGDSVTDVSLSGDGGALVFVIDSESGAFSHTVPMPAFPLISDAEAFAALAGSSASVATDKAEAAHQSALDAAQSALEASQYVGGVADNTISTVKIVDDAVTSPKLSAAVRASLAKADSAAQPADVSAAVSALVDAAPGTLDTLNELAAALGDDPNFATTMATSLAGKAADADVVKLAGSQTVTGLKNYTGGLQINGQSVVATNDSRLSDARPPATGTQFYDTQVPGAGEATTRAVGYNDCALGVKLRRAVTFTEVMYRFGTADSSGSTTVELRKNGVTVSGTQTVVASANQGAGVTLTGSWSFAKNDVISVYVSVVGTGPGKGLVAEVAGLA